MNKKYSFYGKQSVLALAVASGLTFVPALAEAAGLGKITVYSALGQPLRAEVPVSAATEEILGMTARLAPVDSFRESGVEFSPTLLHLQFTTEKRPGGAVIKITSDKPINDPFLDFLLELNWPSGRLVREYTFLLDPIDVASPPPQQIAPRVVAAQQPKVVAQVTPPPPKEEEVDIDELINLQPDPAAAQKKPAAAQQQAQQVQPQPRPTPEKTTKQEVKDSTPPAKTAGPAPAKQDEHIEHQVKPGETLHRIATQNMPEGVSLEQMLVSLYRNNSDAFANNNMNRLRAGAILRMPTQAEATAISPEEARKVFRAQSSDWNAYRRRLASATQSTPAKETDDRSASGRVTASVDEKAAQPNQPKDQVKISRTEQGKGKAGASQEDLIAKENALREAQDRINQLETTINKQEQLLKLNAQRMAELEKQAQTAAKPAAPAIAPAVTAPPAPPVEPPAKVEPPPTQVAANEVPAPPAGETPPATDAPPATEPAPTTAEGTAAPEAPAEATPPAPEATMPPPPKRVEKPPVPPVEEEEPGFLESIGLMPLLAGLGAIGGGIGLLLYRRRRANQMESATGSEFSDDASSFTIGPNSVFNTAGGQSVDTASTPAPPATEFSLAGPGAIDTHEVDPVSEADVYMAYGRDTQAEEILLDALQKDPQRVAIHTKLLEIYAGRRSIKQFETLSSELYSLTGGNGPEWEKVIAMGKEIDPTNPLYGGEKTSDAAQSNRVSAPLEPKPRTVHSIPPPSLSATQDDPLLSLPSEDADTPAPQAVPAAPVVQPAEPAPSSPASPAPMEFSYTSPQPAAQPEPSNTATIVNSASVLDALDFDLSLPAEQESKPVPPAANRPEPLQSAETTVVPSFNTSFETDSGADTFLNLDIATLEENAPEAPSAPPSVIPADGEEDMEFDMNLTASTVLGNVMPSSFDLSAIDLDLTSKPPEQADAAESHDAPSDSQRDEVNTKLDLAKAYEDMGDLEGAMELLKEVLTEGAPDQVEAAQANLTRLGA